MVLSLIIVCSATGFISCVPLQSKNHLDHMNRELVQLIQRLGHSDVVSRCDNEPAILQLQRLAACHEDPPKHGTQNKDG